MTLEEALRRMQEANRLHTFWAEQERIASSKAREHLHKYQATTRTWLYHSDRAEGIKT